MVPTRRGYLLTIEGLDSAGKSEAIPLLLERLVEVISPRTLIESYRDPGSTDVGERLRSALLGTEGTVPPSIITEMLVFIAARAQLVQERILPTLNRGGIVIVDRYTDSTIAYQHHGRGISRDIIDSLHQDVILAPTPDLTVLLDREPADLFTAQSGRVRGDYIENAGMDFWNRVRAGYLALVTEQPERWRRIDASDGPDATDETLWGVVRESLPARYFR